MDDLAIEVIGHVEGSERTATGQRIEHEVGRPHAVGVLGYVQRHAQLAKAFRGELVPQDPNDEPAAELLKRLRAASSDVTTKPARKRRTA
jgi:hypothetical protein